MTRRERERRLRRMAARMELHLVKSSVRDPKKPGYGRYQLSPGTGHIVFTFGPTGEPAATLEQIEDYITADDPGETEREPSSY